MSRFSLLHCKKQYSDMSRFLLLHCTKNNSDMSGSLIWTSYSHVDQLNRSESRVLTRIKTCRKLLALKPIWIWINMLKFLLSKLVMINILLLKFLNPAFCQKSCTFEDIFGGSNIRMQTFYNFFQLCIHDHQGLLGLFEGEVWEVGAQIWRLYWSRQWKV